MHVKSCPKLVRSELRLDLGHQQGALLRRSRVPLSSLSPNTLRPGPLGGAVRARGSENVTEDEGSALDLWTVIRPGHVREKIALFAPEACSERSAKGSWDVSVKRRRRTSHIQSLQPVQALNPVTPQDSPEDEAKLSVVEMVAFLEQRVVPRAPHSSSAKLRSSASITLSRAPAPVTSGPAPSPPDQPVSAEGEEPEAVVSVSDMVARLESQCSRRRSHGERRAVGRVLLAEHSPLNTSQPISTSADLRATPTSSHSLETRKTSLSFCKSDLKVTGFSTERRSKTMQATSISSERRNAIERGKQTAPPSSQTDEAKSKVFCEPEKTPQAKSNALQIPKFTTAAILSAPAFTKVKPQMSEVASAKSVQVEKTGTAPVSSDVADPENSLETEATPPPQPAATPTSFSKSGKVESPSYEEPMPGLLFLTPPKSSFQSENRICLSPASSPNSSSDSFLVLSTSDTQSEMRKTTEMQQLKSPGLSSNSDSFVVLSLDLTVQSQMRAHCSLSLSPTRSSESLKLKMVSCPHFDSLVSASVQSEKRKSQPSSLSPAPDLDSSPIKMLQSGSDFIVQSEKRKSTPVSLSRRSLDLVVQSEKSSQDNIQSEKTYFTVTNNQSVNTKSDETSSVQSEARIFGTKQELSQKRRLHRIDQSEKRQSCPVPISGLLELTVQSEKRTSCSVTDSDWLNSEHSSHSEKSGLVANFGLADLEIHSEQTCPVTNAVKSESGRSELDTPVTEEGPRAPWGSALLRSSSDVGCERRRRRRASRALSLSSAPERPPSASRDFLLLRRRLQSLLEPRPRASYLFLLPHHLLVHILLLLPTRALAALQCTCRYLRLVIHTYGVRPADSLWVSDPRYRDDPCKQCKRRYRRGDVSLCRWHHKPFCQALPYGPGYWMCCRGDRRDAPGCNVGLHDNRWVPAFHSINANMYRSGRRDDGGVA